MQLIIDKVPWLYQLAFSLVVLGAFSIVIFGERSGIRIHLDVCAGV